MRTFLFLYCVGILLGSFLGSSMLVLGFPLMAFCAFMSWAYFQLILPIKRRPWAEAMLALVLGISWHGVWAYEQLLKRLPQHLEGVDLTVSGLVLGLPQQTELTQRFEFSIESGIPEVLNKKIRLDYYGEIPVKGGQRWEFQVRLKQARGFANAGGFDFEAWSLQKGIHGTGYVRPGSEAHIDSSLSLRATIYERLNRYLKEARHGGIVLALTLGNKNSISSDYWDLFSKTGTNHLWVISGLHVGLISAWFYLIAGQVLRFFPPLIARLSLPVICGFSSILAAICYAYLAGFSLPTQRALIMLVVIIGGSLWKRSVSWDLRCLLALALVLSTNPLAVMNPGFWFSFIAVASLLLFSETTGLQSVSKTGIFLIAQWRVWLALFIPLGFWFNQVPLTSPLINIVAIPMVGLLIVPLSLTLVPLVFLSDSFSSYLLKLIDLLIAALFKLLWSVTEVLPQQGLLYFSLDNWFVLVLIGLAICVLMLPTSLKIKALSIPLFIPLIFPETSALEEGEWSLNIFDVGQGLAVLVRTRDHSLLFDAAAGRDAYNSIANSEIIPSLRKQHITHLDVLVISHGDNDHSGGAESLLRKFSVGKVFSNGASELNRFNPAICSSEKNWQWNGILFEFLNTPHELKNSNNNSCVLKVSGMDQSALLPGDIERETEYELSAALRTELNSTILLAPHHGSNSSSTFAFIKQVKPRHVIFSVAYRNQFGHPARSVIERYLSFDALTYSTARLGMISFEISRSHATPYIGSYRRRNPRYWRHQAIGESADITNYWRHARLW